MCIAKALWTSGEKLRSRKRLRASDTYGNLSSFIIADIVSGVFIFGVSLSFLSICILFAAFCKLPAAGLPRGFAGPGCCFCMLSKAATCALRLGRSLKSLISANIAFIPRFR